MCFLRILAGLRCVALAYQACEPPCWINGCGLWTLAHWAQNPEFPDFLRCGCTEAAHGAVSTLTLTWMRSLRVCLVRTLSGSVVCCFGGFALIFSIAAGQPSFCWFGSYPELCVCVCVCLCSHARHRCCTLQPVVG